MMVRKDAVMNNKEHKAEMRNKLQTLRTTIETLKKKQNIPPLCRFNYLFYNK